MLSIVYSNKLRFLKIISESSEMSYLLYFFFFLFTYCILKDIDPIQQTLLSACLGLILYGYAVVSCLPLDSET